MVFIEQYGLTFILFVTFLEYLSLPMPGGILFPLVGFWAKATGRGVWLIIVLSVLVSLAASIILYAIGRFGGKPLAEKLYDRFPKTGQKCREYERKIQEKAWQTVLIARMLPAIRTLIGIPAGFIQMPVVKYMSASTLGIFVWNGVLILGGYLIGYFFL